MRTERGFDRLVNFSDAVVAIAITLLILPLVDTAGEIAHGASIIDLVEENGSQLMVFVISFAVIGRFWLAHHRMYERFANYNLALLWVNLFWLLTIVFLPFPTELIATRGVGSITTVTLYIGTMVLTTLATAVQQYIVIRNPELQAEEVRGTLRLSPSIVATAMMLAALVLAVAFPVLGLWPLLLLGLTGPVNAIVDRALGRPGRTTPLV